MTKQDYEKKNAAYCAVSYVKDGMLLGVGSGTTVKYFVEALSQRVKEGLNIQCHLDND